MLEAAFWGAVGASSLLIGALIGLLVRLPSVVIGLVLGFGAGTLISAVSFELTEEAYAQGGADAVVIGLALGALAYYLGDYVVEKHGAMQRMSSVDSKAVSASASTALLLGAVLDGIPESVVIGASLINEDSASIAVVVAVFLSNVPEAVAASSDLLREGWSRRRVFLMWVIVVAASTIAAGIGYAALKDASGAWISSIQAFSAGAILTMLADEMIPEAFEYTDHNKTVGVALAFGFAVSAALSFRT